MISIHRAEDNPQFIATKRHLMQGYIDMVSCEWNASEKSLQGVSLVVGGDPYEVIIAKSGRTPSACAVSSGTGSLVEHDSKELVRLRIENEENAAVEWNVKFDK
jgi:hypothetical protein